MLRPRPITVQLARDADGQWIATVPSLGLSASASTTDEALSRVRSLAAEPPTQVDDPSGQRDSQAA